jgi:diadenylate cyclase
MIWIQRLITLFDHIRPILDVALLAFLLFKGYELLAKTQALQLIRGAGLVILIYGIALLFKLSTLLWVLNILAPGMFIAIAIVFQPELRKIFMRLGQADFFRPDAKPNLGQLEAVVNAAEMLSQQRRGMLVVFPRKTNIRNIIETGTRINAEISSSLIIAIFQFDGPLHDGALVIQNSRIVAASCVLPLSEQQDIQRSFGTRHRASLGMSEQSDAVVLIVSEETGAISLAFDSKLFYDLSTIEVTRKLNELLDRGSRKTVERDEIAAPALEQGQGSFG